MKSPDILNIQANTLQYAVLQALVKNPSLIPITSIDGFTEFKEIFLEFRHLYESKPDITTEELQRTFTNWVLRVISSDSEIKDVVEQAQYMVNNELIIDDASILEQYKIYVKELKISSTQAKIAIALQNIREASDKNLPQRLNELRQVQDDLEMFMMKEIEDDEDEISLLDSASSIDDLLPTPKVRIPTGITSWDDVNQGVSEGHLWVLGASSGGGKSSIASQLALNMVKSGALVYFVSLEMSPTEVKHRMLANITKTPVEYFPNPDMYTPEFKETIDKEFRDNFSNLSGPISGGDIIIKSTRDSININTLFTKIKQSKKFWIKPKNPNTKKVVLIDYLSLLAGFSNEDGWKKLIEASRIAKLWAEANNILVILLAQAIENQEGEMQLRYSTGINDNADLSWLWKRDISYKDIQDIDVNICPNIFEILDGNPSKMLTRISIPKARSYNPYINDILVFDFKYMTVEPAVGNIDAIRIEMENVNRLMKQRRRAGTALATAGSKSIAARATYKPEPKVEDKPVFDNTPQGFTFI